MVLETEQASAISKSTPSFSISLTCRERPVGLFSDLPAPFPLLSRGLIPGRAALSLSLSLTHTLVMVCRLPCLVVSSLLSNKTILCCVVAAPSWPLSGLLNDTGPGTSMLLPPSRSPQSRAKMHYPLSYIRFITATTANRLLILPLCRAEVGTCDAVF